MTQAPRQAKVEAAVACIVQVFEDYNASFSDITRRAKRRFVTADRAGMNQDIQDRYELYNASIYEAINKLEQILGERLFSRPIWIEIRDQYQESIARCNDQRFYRTFFNTLSRRLFKTTGVDPAIEFTLLDHKKAPHDHISSHPAPWCSHRIFLEDPDSVASWLEEMCSPWPDVDWSAVLGLVQDRLQATYGRAMAKETSIEMLEAVFYRGGRAYRVGRVQMEAGYQPLVLAFDSDGATICLEAMLTQVQEMSILFGYTFNYFMVDLEAVEPVVEFLTTVLPSKPRAELYTVLGRVKQGKTDRYQSFFAHLSAHPAEPLVEAEGKKGMVMLVFTLPSYPLVFKLIRDRFAPSKQVTRSEVLERYHLVFRHDRIGRLIDAQEFRELKLPIAALSPELFEVLMAECARLVEVVGQDVLIHHCYVERRVRPLDLYLAEADEDSALNAVLDYGQAIKDLARSNIFAGDLLPKNFGVTGSGRVVFYDYDELRLMDECRFRHWPQANDDVMVMSDEPWFHVGEDDVFPEQFSLFMGLGRERLVHLKAHHGELFDADWWMGIQQEIREGHWLDVPPFKPEARLTQAEGVDQKNQ
ncbi:MAG TPA: bifunctional isocitrate dehydrogenase kinase/phosphatase [Wenzhouxiangella sp.]